jgi:hypothetical protein
MQDEPFTVWTALKAPTSIMAPASLAVVLAICAYLYANHMA